MMKNILLLTTLLLLTHIGYAQIDFKVSGQIIDNTGNPVSWASVRLQNAIDSSLMDNSYTDDDGFFSLTSKTVNPVFIASFVGYEDIVQPIHNPGGQDFKIETITLQEGVALAAVEVKGRRAKFSYTNGKVTVKVDEKSTNNGVELLETVPMVFIDRNENISIRGKTAKVLINGNDLQLQGEELKAYLETLQSSEIDKVEIITNPSARFDANFNSGVINIILKKNITKTFTTLHARAGYGDFYKLRGGAQFGIAKEKLSLLSSVNYSQSETESLLRVSKTNQDPENPFTLRQRSTWHPTGNYLSARSSLKYSFSEKADVYAFVKYNRSQDDILSQTETNVSDLNQASFISNEDNQWDRWNAGAKYRYEIDTSGTRITFEYLHTNASNRVFADDYSESSLQEYTPPDVLSFTNTSDYQYRINNWQVDYYQPFGKAELEAGLKYSTIHIDNEIQYNFLRLDAPLNYPLPTQSDFLETERIFAAYVSYQQSFEKWSLEAGLRAEKSFMDINLRQPETEINTQQDFFNLFPNVGLTYHLPEGNSLSFTYGRKTNRPYYADLNPTVKLIDQFSYTQGNPYLLPEFSHSADIGLKTGPFLITVYGTLYNNSIDSYLYQSDTSAVSVLTKINFLSSKRAGISANTSFSISDKFDVYMYGRVGYSESNFLNGEQRISNEVISGRLSVNSTYYLNKKIKLSLSGYYATPRIEGIYRIRDTYAINARASYQLDNLSLTLAMNDIFKTGRWDSSIDTEDLQASWNNQWERGVVTLALRYKFGAKNVNASDYGSRTTTAEERRVGQ